MSSDPSMPDADLVEAPRNRVLASLGRSDLSAIASHLEPVALKLRENLETAHRAIRYVYFVERGIVSVAAVGPGDPMGAEIGLIGREGMTGSSVLLGSSRSPHQTFVQVEGSAQRIGVEDLQRAMAESRALTACFLRYAHCFAVQVAHTARANATGHIDERLARWLLMARDRVGDNLPLTHDFLAVVLGVRRAGVTGALNELHEGGILRCKRSQIAIVSPEALRKRAGSLYGVPEAEFDRLFPKAPS